MSFQKDILVRLDKIDDRLTAQTIQLELQNKELTEHTRRSTHLESRVIPLEQSHVFWNKLSKTVLTLIATGAACATMYRYFFSK